jgi:hypothetical protein
MAKSMGRKFEFFVTKMPGTRPADFYLGCMDGSVYLDFDLTEDECICLRRISFDGYGCCNLYEDNNHLDKQQSEVFIAELAKEVLDQSVLTPIILQLIGMNIKNIWRDALEEYMFITGK